MLGGGRAAARKEKPTQTVRDNQRQPETARDSQRQPETARGRQTDTQTHTQESAGQRDTMAGGVQEGCGQKKREKREGGTTNLWV